MDIVLGSLFDDLHHYVSVPRKVVRRLCWRARVKSMAGTVHTMAALDQTWCLNDYLTYILKQLSSSSMAS